MAPLGHDLKTSVISIKRQKVLPASLQVKPFELHERKLSFRSKMR
jgi:hypothetical protein